MERYLAFDFGTKRIGVAAGQKITCTAQGIETVQNTPRGPDWAAILRLVKEWSPKALIVGLPLNMDGSPSDMSDIATAFAEELERRTGINVYTIDERLTTRDAREQIKQNKPKKYAYEKVDTYAAKLILETWFSTQ